MGLTVTTKSQVKPADIDPGGSNLQSKNQKAILKTIHEPYATWQQNNISCYYITNLYRLGIKKFDWFKAGL